MPIAGILGVPPIAKHPSSYTSGITFRLACRNLTSRCQSHTTDNRTPIAGPDADPTKLLLTLINNGEALWDGSIEVKGQQIESCFEWLSSGEICVEDGKLLAALPPTDVRIYELTCNEPFLEFV